MLNISIDEDKGIAYVNGVLYKRCPAKPDRLSTYYMTEGHCFVPLKGNTPTQLANHAQGIVAEGEYNGLLCPAILLSDEEEVRRVGKGVNAEEGFPIAELRKWVKTLEEDEDVMRLLAEQKEYTPDYTNEDYK